MTVLINTSDVITGMCLDSVNDITGKRMIELKWHTGEKMLFPYIFLRDSCQCESCFHPFTKARLILMKDLKVDSFPTELQVIKF